MGGNIAISIGKRLRILQLLDEGFCQKDIATRLKLGKSTISYHVNNFIEDGYILEVKDEKDRPTSPKLYSATDKGKSMLTATISTFLREGETKIPQKPIFQLHHVHWKYPVLKSCPLHMNVEIQMNNWIKKQDEYKFCKVTLTTQSLIIHVKKLIGPNPDQLELTSRNIADKMISFYEENFGMEFGRPVRAGKPHFAVIDKEDIIWERFQENVYIQTKSAIMDETPPKTQEFTSVEAITNYMEVGNNVVELKNKVDGLETVLAQMRDLLDAFLKSQTYEKLPEKDEKKDVA